MGNTVAQSAMPPQASDNNNNNQIMNLQMQEIMMQLKAHLPNPKKVSYVYFVMCVLSEVGIARQSEVIKAITEVQKELNKVIGDLNELEKLLREIQNQGWGSKGAFGPDPDPKWKNGFKWNSKAYDPSKHSDMANKDQMEKQIIKWMHEKSNISDGKGGYLTNAQALQHTWTDLYGTGKNGDNGVMGKLKAALENPIYKQEVGSGYNSIAGLDGNGSVLGSNTWRYQDGWNGPYMSSFLDFLQGKNDNIGQAAAAMATAFCDSYYNKTGAKPNDASKTASYNDDVGDLISNSLEIGKQTLNGLNSTEAADLSMFSQNIISMIQEGQQMIKYGGQETQQYVANQKPQ